MKTQHTFALNNYYNHLLKPDVLQYVIVSGQHAVKTHPWLPKIVVAISGRVKNDQGLSIDPMLLVRFFLKWLCDYN